MFRLVAPLIAVLGLSLIAAFTPVIPWLTGILGSTWEVPQPPTNSTAPPVVVPKEIEPSPPAEISQLENVIIFSEKELQSKLDTLVDIINLSGEAEIEYIRVKLEQDKMLVSIKGEALGSQVEAENMEVRFEGRTVFASGKVDAFGVSPTLTAEVEVYTEEGRPSVEVKTFRLGALPLKILGLSKDKISGIINDAIESRGLKLPVDLESIRIEDAKLIVEFKQG